MCNVGPTAPNAPCATHVLHSQVPPLVLVTVLTCGRRGQCQCRGVEKNTVPGPDCRLASHAPHPGPPGQQQHRPWRTSWGRYHTRMRRVLLGSAAEAAAAKAEQEDRAWIPPKLRQGVGVRNECEGMMKVQSMPRELPTYLPTYV